MRTALLAAVGTALLAGLAITLAVATGTAFAEFGSVEQGNDTALLASGAGAVVVVAGLGLTAPRRRAAAHD